MKKIYTIILMTLTATLAQAATHNVSVLGSSFSPTTINAVCGDTVTWHWQGGAHTTTSTTIPGCATSWNSPIDGSTTSFSYVIPCLGTYNYQCTPHGFTGTIVVTSCPTGIEAPATGNSIIISPNPSADGIFNLMFTDYNNLPQRIYVMNVDGKKIMEENYIPATTNHSINLKSFAPGIYFLLTEGEKGRTVYKLVR